MKEKIVPELKAMFEGAEGVDHVYTQDDFAAQGIPLATVGDQSPALFITAKPDYLLENGDTGEFISLSSGMAPTAIAIPIPGWVLFSSRGEQVYAEAYIWIPSTISMSPLP